MIYHVCFGWFAMTTILMWPTTTCTSSRDLRMLWVWHGRKRMRGSVTTPTNGIPLTSRFVGWKWFQGKTTQSFIQSISFTIQQYLWIVTLWQRWKCVDQDFLKKRQLSLRWRWAVQSWTTCWRYSSQPPYSLSSASQQELSSRTIWTWSFKLTSPSFLSYLPCKFHLTNIAIFISFQLLRTLPDSTSDLLLQNDRHLDAFHFDCPISWSGPSHHERGV